MKLTITNRDGEVYAILTEVAQDASGKWVATDEEGLVTRLDQVLESASRWMVVAE